MICTILGLLIAEALAFSNMKPLGDDEELYKTKTWYVMGHPEKGDNKDTQWLWVEDTDFKTYKKASSTKTTAESYLQFESEDKLFGLTIASQKKLGLELADDHACALGANSWYQASAYTLLTTLGSHKDTNFLPSFSYSMNCQEKMKVWNNHIEKEEKYVEYGWPGDCRKDNLTEAYLAVTAGIAAGLVDEACVASKNEVKPESCPEKCDEGSSGKFQVYAKHTVGFVRYGYSADDVKTALVNYGPVSGSFNVDSAELEKFYAGKDGDKNLEKDSVLSKGDAKEQLNGMILGWGLKKEEAAKSNADTKYFVVARVSGEIAMRKYGSTQTNIWKIAEDALVSGDEATLSGYVASSAAFSFAPSRLCAIVAAIAAVLMF